MIKSLRRAGKTVVLLLAATAVVLAVAVAPVQARPATDQVDADRPRVPSNCHYSNPQNPDDSGGVDIYAYCENLGSDDNGLIETKFVSYGESLRVCDYFTNGHRTYVWLTVDGFGTARFSSYGSDSCEHHPAENYPEGRDVSLRLCSSLEPGAKCMEADGGTT